MTDSKTCSFFGHRRFVSLNKTALINTVFHLINNGVKRFLVGTHGDFDKLVYLTLSEVKKEYPAIEIDVVFTNNIVFNKDKYGYSVNEYYPQAKCITYSVEHLHFKQRVIKTNKLMIDESDVVCCYVNMTEIKSGAKQALLYAQKQNKQIINLFNQNS